MVGELESTVRAVPGWTKAGIGVGVVFVLGMSVGGFVVGQFNLPSRVTNLEGVVRDSLFPAIRQVQADVIEIRSQNERLFSRLDELVCANHGVPNTICVWWLNNGRPQLPIEP
jgi:hypothetical protein